MREYDDLYGYSPCPGPDLSAGGYTHIPDDHDVGFGTWGDALVCDAAFALRLPEDLLPTWPFRPPASGPPPVEPAAPIEAGEPVAPAAPEGKRRKPRPNAAEREERRRLERLSEHARNFAAAQAIIHLRVMTEGDRLDVIAAVSGNDATIAAGFALDRLPAEEEVGAASAAAPVAAESGSTGGPASGNTASGGRPGSGGTVEHRTKEDRTREHGTTGLGIADLLNCGPPPRKPGDRRLGPPPGLALGYGTTPCVPSLMVYSRRCRVDSLAHNLAGLVMAITGGALTRTVTGALVALDKDGIPVDHAELGGDAFIVHECLDCPHDREPPEEYRYSGRPSGAELKRQLSEELLRYFMWAAAGRAPRKAARHSSPPARGEPCARGPSYAPGRPFDSSAAF